MQLLPVSKIVLEMSRFAFMTPDHPHIGKWQYQKGPLSGHGSVKEAVSARQDGHCLLCHSPIDHDHHIVPRSRRGSDTVGNLCGLCEKRHAPVHRDEKWKKAGMAKKYGSLSVLPSLAGEPAQILPEGSVFITTGRETAAYRADHRIEKSHQWDDWCIACSILEHQTVIVSPHSRAFAGMTAKGAAEPCRTAGTA